MCLEYMEKRRREGDIRPPFIIEKTASFVIAAPLLTHEREFSNTRKRFSRELLHPIPPPEPQPGVFWSPHGASAKEDGNLMRRLTERHSI